MKVQYVGPLGSVVIDALGLTVNHGESVEVPTAIAGTPPSVDFLAAMAAVDAAHLLSFPERHQAFALAKERLIDMADQCGSGLLAQPDAWVIPAKAKTTPKDGE